VARPGLGVSHAAGNPPARLRCRRRSIGIRLNVVGSCRGSTPFAANSRPSSSKVITASRSPSPPTGQAPAYTIWSPAPAWCRRYRASATGGVVTGAR
jgi:hypothetical protein